MEKANRSIIARYSSRAIVLWIRPHDVLVTVDFFLLVCHTIDGSSAPDTFPHSSTIGRVVAGSKTTGSMTPFDVVEIYTSPQQEVTECLRKRPRK